VWFEVDHMSRPADDRTTRADAISS
jgi:hypothetical protein